MSQPFKPIPTNISKDDLLKAIEKIDLEGVPKNADSNYYDVIFNGKKYPPKVIVSFANLFANGEVLDRETFPGGLNTACFKLLETNGFEIKEKKVKNEIAKNFVQNVMIYEVSSSAVKNAIELRNNELGYFYWNDKTFQKLQKGDYVFVVIRGNNEVFFTTLEENEINIKEQDQAFTYFSDLHKSFKVSGKYSQFVRLKIILSLPTTNDWKWKTLGSGEFTYLSGPHINKEKAGNRIANIKQLMELSDNEEFNKILSLCLLNFDVTPNKDTLKGYSNLITQFVSASAQQNLYFPSYLTKRYVASLATKPFVIFTGLSGSGKTKLAQTFAKWICESEAQFKIIPVGADWTNREPLLGYPNSLDSKNYVLPDNGALALVIDAINEAKGKALMDCKPYFLILDEMNLSHVERYFADFLSAMESKEAISLYKGEIRTDSTGKEIPQQIVLPQNLFIVGTVNIDETTYMFSPKVLDRANTIEFRLDESDIRSFFSKEITTNPAPIDSEGSLFVSKFMELVAADSKGTTTDAAALLEFFDELQKLGAEYGYRTASEMLKLMQKLEAFELESDKKESALDVAVMQKLLPKLHGSRSKLVKVLPVLASFCINDKEVETAKVLLEKYKSERTLVEEENKKVLLPLAFTKIGRMYTNAIENGFANYAEG